MAGVAVARLAREPRWEQLVAAYRAQLAFTLFLIALPALVGQISVVWMGMAICFSAIIFGLSHLPALTSSGSNPSLTSVSLILGGNMLFGLLAEYLFWQYGLEAAIFAFAHALAHGLAVARPMIKQ